MNLRAFDLASWIILALCWVVFCIFFGLRRPHPGEKTTRRDRRSVLGMVLQGVGFAAVSIVRRPWHSPFLPLPGILQALPPLAVAVLAVASCWLALAAVRTLGKNWSYQARLVEGHRLITAGPYGRMRHPIYSAMLGYLLATGFAVSHWLGVILGVVFLSIGSAIRAGAEERLLRAQFGREYEEYARRVPAILPRI